MTAVRVILNNGEVIKFETNDATHDAGTSYAVDNAGVLTIKCRQVSAGEVVTTHQRFSQAAWHCVEEADAPVHCSPPAWSGGVIGSSIPRRR